MARYGCQLVSCPLLHFTTYLGSKKRSGGRGVGTWCKSDESHAVILTANNSGADVVRERAE